MRKILFFLAVLVSVVGLQARTITEGMALERVASFVKKPDISRRLKMGKTVKPQLAYKSEINSTSVGYYVFNIGNNSGFVIVAGDDNANEILGYSDSGDFNYSELPSNVKGWLSGYDAEIKYISDNIVEEKTQPANIDLQGEVKPLLGDIAWDQGSPYNDMCPAYYGSYRSATGCVATAIAQILYYHKYPATGVGSHSYTPLRYGSNIGELSVDYSQSNYQWDKMTPTYDSSSSEESKRAVAKLMYDCGVAVDMDYGAESGTMSQYLCEPLVNNFQYDKGIALRMRSYYGIEEWDSMIRNEIASGRPVFATGYTSAGGHAFVFDGYDMQGFIHVNWGWSKMSNGYFRTTALTPASQGTGGSNGGFNYKQLIITGIMPPQVDSEYDIELISSEKLRASSSNFSKNEMVSVELRGKITNVGWQDAVCDFGVGIFNENGDLLFVQESEKSVKIAKDGVKYGVQFGEISLSKITSDGQYRMYPVCRVSDGKNWVKVRDIYIGNPNYLTVEVSGDNIHIGQTGYFELSATDIEVGDIYQNINNNIKATILNIGDSEYYGEVKAALYNTTNKRKIAETSGYIVDLLPGESSELNIIEAFSVEPGDYYFALIDDDLMKLNDLIPVTVKAAPADEAKLVAASQLSFPDNENVEQNKMEITAEIKCESGIYSGAVYIYIYDKDGESIMGCLNPEHVVLSAGETASVSFSGPFENGVPGTTYKACLVNGNSMTFITPTETASCLFTLKNTSGSVGGIETSSMERIVYTVSGIKVNDVSNLSPGVYIVKESGNNGTRTYKMIKR